MGTVREGSRPLEHGSGSCLSCLDDVLFEFGPYHPVNETEQISVLS